MNFGSLNLRSMLAFVERDVMVMVKTPFIVINRGIYFIVQVFVFAFFVNRLIKVPGLDYFTFFSYGAVVATAASVAFVIGYEIYEEAEVGLLDYLLSLPASRLSFILARALGGTLRSIVYVTPMFILVLLITGISNILSVLQAYVVLFLLSLGITGFSITLAVAIRNESRFDITLAFCELLLVRFSSALYPRNFMPLFAQFFAEYSPVSLSAEGVRSAILTGLIEPNVFLELATFVAIFFSLGASFYFRKIEGGYFD